MSYTSRICKELSPLILCGVLAAACAREPQRPSTSPEGLVFPPKPHGVVLSQSPTPAIEITLQPTIRPTDIPTTTSTPIPTSTITPTLTSEPTFTATPEPTPTFTPTLTIEPTLQPPTLTPAPLRYTRTRTPLPVNAGQVIEKIITANRAPESPLGAEIYTVTLESCGIPDGVLVCDQTSYSVDRIVFMSSSRGQVVPYSSYTAFPQIGQQTIKP